METVNRFAAIFVIRDQSAPYGWMGIIRSDQGMAIERSDSDSILMIMCLASTGGAITPPDASATGFLILFPSRGPEEGSFINIKDVLKGVHHAHASIQRLR